MNHQAFYESVPAKAAALSAALGERDDHTYKHCGRVAGLSVDLGRACGLSRREMRLLTIAAGFHDIGKIGIPDGILKKATPLSEIEWAVMRAHSVKGEHIVRAADIDEGDRIAEAVRNHHERYDGSGYPDGLSGESIPFLARIIAVADAYDAMTSPRVYAATKSHSQVLRTLREEQGRQHDAYVVKMFIRAITKSRFRVA